MDIASPPILVVNGNPYDRQPVADFGGYRS